MSNNRNRGAIAKKLNDDVLLKLGREIFAKECPGENPDLLGAYGPQMIFTVDHGECAVVNFEGVGHIADEDNEVSVYFTHCMSLIALKISVSDLGEAVTDEEIDLADGIRTFGSRLDSNHFLWFSRYHGK